MEAIIAIIGGLGLMALVIAYSTFTWALVVYKYYYWFVLPLFTDLPAIDYKQAIMLVFILSLFKTHSTVSIKKEYKDETDAWVYLILLPWISLFMGWIFS
jgi:hypothetical protein